MAKVVCVESFVGATKKGTIRAARGEVVEASDPRVKARPDRFVTPEVWADMTAPKPGRSRLYVEQATAAPGESRSVKKPKKAKADADA